MAGWRESPVVVAWVFGTKLLIQGFGLVETRAVGGGWMSTVSTVRLQPVSRGGEPERVVPLKTGQRPVPHPTLTRISYPELIIIVV